MPFHHQGTEYLAASEAAAALDVAPSTLRNYLNRGVLPEPAKIQRGRKVLRGFTVDWVREAKERLYGDPRSGEWRG